MDFIKTWFEKYRKKELEQEQKDRINQIMFNLLDDKTTEESIQLIRLVNKRFENILKERKINLLLLQNQNKIEQELIENYLDY